MEPYDTPRIQGNTVLESAFQRFPAEILGEVFTGVLQDDITDPSYETMKQLIDICLVCRDWRDAALVAHELWRTLELPGKLTLQALEKAQQWLGRAKTLPKGLAISAPRSGHEDHYDKPDDCFLTNPAVAKSLIEGVMAIYHLTIACPSPACVYPLLTIFHSTSGGSNAWNGIKSFKLHFLDSCSRRRGPYDPSEGMLSSPTYPIFRYLPPVTSLSIRLPLNYRSEADQSFPSEIPVETLASLKDLTLSCNFLTKKIMKILESCQNVERLTLDLNRSSLSQGFGLCHDAALMPSVRKLRIRQQVPFDALRYFTTPLLEELDLEFTDWVPRHPHHMLVMESVISLLQRSQCADTVSQVWLRRTHPMDVQRLQIRVPFLKEPHFSAKSQTVDMVDGLAVRTWSMSRRG